MREYQKGERILEVKDLELGFNTYAGQVQALRGVDFHLNKGETLAIVGESGSGKSVTIKAVTKLLAANGVIKNGSITYKGQDILHMSDKEFSVLRGNEISLIFQDPLSSLDPVMKIGKQITETLRIKLKMSKEQAKARALITQPDLLIADEPISALDVSIQAQILNILNDLRKELGLTILFIAHDLSVVKYFSNRVAVMNAGRIVEMSSSDEIYRDPQHAYTKSLLSAIPVPDPLVEKKRQRIHYDKASGVYQPEDNPLLREIKPGHFVLMSDNEWAAYQKANA